MAEKRRQEAEIPIRVKTVGEPPALAQAIVSYLQKQCQQAGRVWGSFSFDGLPMTVNHMYIHTRFGTRLKPEVQEFRAKLKHAMGPLVDSWRPTGACAALILLQSPYWVTKERLLRKMDADNRVKPIFDAIEQATGQVDERFWHHHAFKVVSKRERCAVYLFDLGDVVDYYF